MPFIANDAFFCRSLNREVTAGESLDITEEDAKEYKGLVRRTTLGRARTKRPFVYGKAVKR